MYTGKIYRNLPTIDANVFTHEHFCVRTSFHSKYFCTRTSWMRTPLESSVLQTQTSRF